MRFKRRSAAIIALAVVGALSVAGIALAATSSTVSFKFSPSKVSKTTPKAGQINLHTHTNYANTSSNYTDRADLFFDSDFSFNTNAVGKCNKTSISGTKTMAQAMAACGSKLIGKGTATAAAGTNTVHACVLAFNGSGTGGHVLLFTRANAAPPFTMTCGTPSSNTPGQHQRAPGRRAEGGQQGRLRQAAGLPAHPCSLAAPADRLQRHGRQAIVLTAGNFFTCFAAKCSQLHQEVEAADQVHLQRRNADQERNPEVHGRLSEVGVQA